MAIESTHKKQRTEAHSPAAVKVAAVSVVVFLLLAIVLLATGVIDFTRLGGL